MDTALIVLGLLIGVVLLGWGYSFMSDAREVDREEEKRVRSETPEEHERAAFEDQMEKAGHAAEQADLYSTDTSSADGDSTT